MRWYKQTMFDHYFMFIFVATCYFLLSFALHHGPFPKVTINATSSSHDVIYLSVSYFPSLCWWIIVMGYTLMISPLLFYDSYKFYLHDTGSVHWTCNYYRKLHFVSICGGAFRQQLPYIFEFKQQAQLNHLQPIHMIAEAEVVDA